MYLLTIKQMETTYFGLFAKFTTYLLLISLKNTTFLLLLSSNVGKVAEFWTLAAPPALPAALSSATADPDEVGLEIVWPKLNLHFTSLQARTLQP